MPDSDKPYFVHESAYVDAGAEIGAGTKIWHFSHVMSGARIGPKCNLGQNVLVANDVGAALLLTPGGRYHEVATNYLDAGCGATPAVAGRLLLLRGGEKLYCVGKEQAPKPEARNP